MQKKQFIKMNNFLSYKSTSYLLSLWDSSTGGFRFAPHQPPTLMATSYSVLGLEFLNGLEQFTDTQRTGIINFLTAKVNSRGEFHDPLFQASDILSQEHDFSYFQEETTTFCQQALDALQAPPPPPREWAWNNKEGLLEYFGSIPWKNPWLDSNRVMFALSQLCHDADRHHKPELLNLVDAGLDWLDAHQSSETGLWQGSHEVNLTNAMAATFHFTFYYSFRCRPLLYSDRIIDSCLKLQESHGLFSGNAVGNSCLDYDALDLLAKASLVTDYRADDVKVTRQIASLALQQLCNPDGGFANCKEYMPLVGRKVKLLKKLGLSKIFPLTSRFPAQDLYTVCWNLLSCDNIKSNSHSTWFRLLAIRLASQNEWLNTQSAKDFTFRRLPFLGYHDPLAVINSIKTFKTTS